MYSIRLATGNAGPREVPRIPVHAQLGDPMRMFTTPHSDSTQRAARTLVSNNKDVSLFTSKSADV